MAIAAVVQAKHRTGGDVRRIRGLLPCRYVAAYGAASVWRDLQIVIVIDVAGSAWHASVALGQQKSRGAMVKLGIQPRIERVAGVAGGGKFCRTVIRISG